MERERGDRMDEETGATQADVDRGAHLPRRRARARYYFQGFGVSYDFMLALFTYSYIDILCLM